MNKEKRNSKDIEESRVADPDSDRIRILIVSGFNQDSGSGSVFGGRIRIRNPDPDTDPGGQKRPTKVEKIKKFHVLKSWMFSFEN